MKQFACNTGQRLEYTINGFKDWVHSQSYGTFRFTVFFEPENDPMRFLPENGHELVFKFTYRALPPKELEAEFFDERLGQEEQVEY